MRASILRAALVTASLLVPVSRIVAQETPVPAPSVVPADSTKRDGPPLEMRVAVLSLMTNLSVASGTTAATASASLAGAELVFRSLDGGGILMRYASGSVGSGVTAGKLSLLDGRLEIGSRTVLLELGYMLRSESVSGVTTQNGYARGGFRTNFHFGSSGIVADLEASYFKDPSQEKNGITGSGIEGESSVLYAIPKLPIYVQLGFRRETWNYTGPVAVSAEEWSTVFLGGGFQLGLP